MDLMDIFFTIKIINKMFNLLHKLYDDYLKTNTDDEDAKKYFETHHAVLLKSTKEMYAAQRTALSLHHQLYTKFSKKEQKNDGSLRHSLMCSVDFLSDGGIMEGNFLANEEFKGVYFRPENGVVEAGHFKNKVLFYGIRICENGDFEEGLFVDCKLMNGIRYLLNGKFEEVGTRDWESVSDRSVSDRSVSDRSVSDRSVSDRSGSDSENESLDQEVLVKEKKAAERKHLDGLMELDDELNDRALAEYSEGEDNDDNDYLSE
jgi:hypothetical protein